ncbi:twin transmembrane helix small protein [Enterovirga sp. CN4-39]|uniref:twin transmembrane helix small protein n=1 Tax=Enterovirga sp. CN4-39 TaxID=3400910 RepID=UPI003C0B46B6
MSGSSLLVLLATLAVAGVLLLGLVNMMRGGPAQKSQKLMRLRVMLQFAAIVLIMLVLWWRGGSGS